MPHRTRARLLLLVALAAASTSIQAQPAPHRPPAVPLVVNDPYFSIWSMADRLTDAPTKHWTESLEALTGLARIDGKPFRWMGGDPRATSGAFAAPPMQQVSLQVEPLHTRYQFSAGGVRLDVTFFTPLFPSDLDVLSRPVTYLSLAASSEDGRPHSVDLLLDVNPEIAVNELSQPVTWGRAQAPGLNILRIGTRDQNYLHQAGDKIRIDWGYFDLCVPAGAGAVEEASAGALDEFDRTGHLSGNDDLEQPRPAWSSDTVAAHLAVAFSLDNVSAQPVTRHVLLAYSDTYSIEYLGRRLHAYWQRNGMSEAEMLTAAEKDYPSLEDRGVAFDNALDADMTKVGGPEYAYLTALVFRQTIAAHKLVADVDGTPMLFSKENASNGCIDTVDVTYPSSPFFLLFNPKLLQAQLEPLMRYAALPRWKFPFAPHDLGTYPLADGQVYGGGETNEVDQMPVEESGNLILMVAALGRSEGNWDFARRFMPQLTAWANYLAAKGMDPENQLSTDDFAGHLAHNTNLSIKAIEALGAFVEIARGVGDEKLAAHFQQMVRPLPAQWEKMAFDGDHYRLAFDQPNTWSQKYNLVWDQLLDLHLFPPKIAQTEWSFYARNMKPYGLPLDNRKTFTKLDWEIWTAALTGNRQQSDDLVHRIVSWLDSTPSRVPTTDWYDTISGQQQGFQARSVVGGVFIRALLDPEVAAHWRNGAVAASSQSAP